MLNKKALAATAGGAEPLYVEDVFSTYLYTGNSSTRSIQNGIDLSGEGGLVWVKRRTPGEYHVLTDTVRGANKQLFTNLTSSESSQSNQITGFNSDGFSLGADTSLGWTNLSPYTYASWTFRKAEKFFDVVTWTGDGSSSRAISHSLGSTPGCIIIKCTSTGSTNWIVWHNAFTSGQNLELNTTGGGPYANAYFSPLPTSTQFTLSSVGSGGFVDNTNASGRTYVAYLFAHDAGGFGDSGSESVIKCGSYTIDGSGNASVNLGWEPQWILYKKTNSTSNWFLSDNMRGFNAVSSVALYPNLSNAEDAGYAKKVNATGFTTSGETSGDTWVYIAIRRGPMKTPEAGTEVFSPVAYTGNSTDNTTIQNLTTNIASDASWIMARSISSQYPMTVDKLRGSGRALYQNSTIVEENFSSAYPGASISFNNTQTVLAGKVTAVAAYNNSGTTQIAWNFRRAPGFFDVVCYTGTGSARTVTHNLGVAPELLIVKSRSSGTEHWNVYNNQSGATKYMRLNQTLAASTGSTYWNDTAPTSSVFTVGTDGGVNASGGTYVAYLFASVAGVSKVGSYTGTGTTLQVNCGFTGGARFVMIKRTDSTGDWYVWDSARGIVSGNDPYLLMNTTGAEVTSTDYVDTYSAGFEISSTAPAAINANGGTYIFLAVS